MGTIRSAAEPLVTEERSRGNKQLNFEQTQHPFTKQFKCIEF